MNNSTHQGVPTVSAASLLSASAPSFVRWALAVGLVLVSIAAQAQQKAGEVAHLQGMATAQQGGSVRFLGRGDAILSGDVISTTDKGFAVVNLSDGSKFTLRPSTTFSLDRFQHDQGTESTAMRLLRGGMRMVTGLIGKRNPGGVELKINTATIGIRGTSFDARICGDDCRAEGVLPVAAAAPPPGAPAAPVLGPVVARVVQSSGEIAATQPGGQARPLSVGAALYEGDNVRSGAGGVAVIGFRDQSRVSINPQTIVRIDSFSYKQPKADSMVLSLLKGGLRAFTGVIGKTTSDSFSVRTRTSTIGIRGTGMDISCEGPCADASLGEPAGGPPVDPANPRQPDGLFMLTWEGSTYFFVGSLDVPLNQVGFIGTDNFARLLPTIPAFFNNFGSPRPDQVDVDWDILFAVNEPTGADGFYLYVRDGHVYMDSGKDRIDLGVGESGYIGQIGSARRVIPPGFMTRDPFPIPEYFNPAQPPVFQLFGVTLGQPGQEICRL